MGRPIFIRIVNAVKGHDDFFSQRRDCIGRLGLSTLQKITAAFRVLAYAITADATDEYINIGESTAVECVKRFCRAVVELFGEHYLRSPTTNGIARLLHIGRQRGFPGTNNDINVLDRTHLFSDLIRGTAPPAHYVIQEREYNTGYYLADNIYPKWSTLVQTIRDPRSAKNKYFAMKQESSRKDVERAFGVLQSRFAIVANPARFQNKNDLRDIMSACIIMHNMIIEDERDLNAPIEAAIEVPPSEIEMVGNDTSSFQEFVARYRKIRDKDAHIALRNALIDHLWEEYSNSEA